MDGTQLSSYGGHTASLPYPLECCNPLIFISSVARLFNRNLASLRTLLS